jgi:hypothetical protein
MGPPMLDYSREPVPVEVTVSARNEMITSTDGGGRSSRKSKNGAKFE